MLKEELEKMLGIAPRDNYVTQNPSAITYMKEGKVVPTPIEKKKVAPTNPKTSTAPVMDSNILGKEAMKLMAPSAPERSNYVEMLPQDVAAQKKVAPEKLEQIKKQFKLAPTPQSSMPQGSAQPAKAPEQQETSSGSDNLYLKESTQPSPERKPSYSEMIDGMKEKAGWGDILPALAPLLAGALMGGNTGAASGITADYLLGNVSDREKRNRGLEDKLLEIEKAKAKEVNKVGNLNKRFQSRPIWDPELKRSVYANYDTVTGEMYHLDGTPIKNKGVEVGFAVTPEEASRRAAMAFGYKKAGIDYTPRLNTESGLYERAGGQRVFKQEFDLSPVQRRALEAQSKTITSSKQFQEARSTLAGAEKVRGLLAMGNPAAINSARLTILKMAGNVGATSDKDLALIQGDPSVVATAQRIKGRLIDGEPMLAADIAALNQIANLYYKKAQKDMARSLEESDKQFSKKYKVPAGTLKSEVFPQAVDAMPNRQNMVRVQAPNGKTGYMPKDKLQKAMEEYKKTKNPNKNFKVIE
jgi:hypothetical protein